MHRPSVNPAIGRSLPKVQMKKSSHIKDIIIISFSRLIRWLTGHCFLNRQNNLADPVKFPDPICSLCHEEPERAIHVLAFCPVLSYERMSSFGCITQPPIDPCWSVNQMLTFLNVKRVKTWKTTNNHQPPSTIYQLFSCSIVA